MSKRMYEHPDFNYDLMVELKNVKVSPLLGENIEFLGGFGCSGYIKFGTIECEMEDPPETVPVLGHPEGKIEYRKVLVIEDPHRMWTQTSVSLYVWTTGGEIVGGEFAGKELGPEEEGEFREIVKSSGLRFA